MSTTVNAVYAESRAAWRQWLSEHYASEKSVWLTIYKKTSATPSVYYDEAVDEALCFGWVDSSIRKGNEQYYLQFFARRNPKSNWSRVNKEKVERLIRDGLMTDAGMALIDLAKQTGTWTALDEVEKLIYPPNLQEQLDANTVAREHFDLFPRSVKRGILEWLLNARTPATRAKRIAEIVTRAERNERAHHRPNA